MTELSEFLLARIAEDEETARATRSRKWDAVADGVEADDQDGELPNDLICEVDDWNRGTDGQPTRARAEHIARHDPARVLAECDARRRIVDHVSDQWDDAGFPIEGRTSTWLPDEWGKVLRLLALPYADHPDYRDEWKP